MRLVWPLFGPDARNRPTQRRRPIGSEPSRTQRHRLDLGGNRQLNAALYRIAATHARYHAPARAYLEPKRSEGKSKREALHCLRNDSPSASSSTPSKRAPH